VQYAFEDYVIDSDRRELTHSAELIAVGPQVFDLLLHLVRNREHVVSKDELLAAVWAGRIVSESTLTSHINAARKAIGDSGQNQRLLRTIARKGFRFVGDVSEIASRSAAASTEPDAPGKTIVEAPALPDRPSIACARRRTRCASPVS
jgi:DNA-binding winged helix-turn-helix (wHTH) protein